MREYFSELYGNDFIKNRLGVLIQKNTLPHAFLVLGPSGTGKKTFARELISALNCERRDSSASALPCHVCNTCRRIREGNFTDVMHLARQDGKATIGVEEVRLFREDMFLSATEANYKVYVIDEADKLTLSAQNALLTVLEEPPKNVVIILLAESTDKILTTVKSRVQTIPMQRFSSEELREYLIRSNEKARLYSMTNPEALSGILMSSDGRIGRALSLLSDKEAKENLENRQLTEKIVNALKPACPYSELYSALANLPTSRADFTEAFESVLCAIRDISLIKFDKNLPLLFYTSAEDAALASRDLSVKRLFSIYEVIKGALEDSSKNVSTSAIIADLGAKIKMI